MAYKDAAKGGAGESWGDAGDTAQYPDYSEELNGVIKKCCDEYLPTWTYWLPVAGLASEGANASIWINGVFNNWDFVADMWWKDENTEERKYDSYIPDDIQGKVPTSNQDYFIVNGHKMNREQYGNYVKGATAQYAFPGLTTSTLVNILGLGKSVYDNIKRPDLYDFSWDNEIDDSYFVYLGAWDMATGNIK